MWNEKAEFVFHAKQLLLFANTLWIVTKVSDNWNSWVYLTTNIGTDKVKKLPANEILNYY